MRRILAPIFATLAVSACAGVVSGADLAATYDTSFPCNTAGGPIWAMAVSSTGTLTIGGTFGAVGTLTVADVAQWNGTTWSALGQGLNNSVTGLAYDRTGALCAGGTFTASGTTTLAGAARWTGSSWQPMGNGVSGQPVVSQASGITAFASDSSGDIVAIGNFDHVGATSAPHIALWNGSGWSALGGGLPSTTVTPTAVALASSAAIYAADGTADGVVHFWNGTVWTTLAALPGTPTITALAVDTLGDVWAGDANGEVWEYTSGAWIDQPGTNPTTGAVQDPVTALLVAPGGVVYASTLFNIYVWDGSAWEIVDNGLGAFPAVLAAASDGTLYRGAEEAQTEVSGLTGIVSQWNGSTWSALTTGLDNAILAAAVDSSGNVDFCGRTTSTTVPKPTFGVFQLRGSTITALGNLQAADLPHAITVTTGGQVYVGLDSTTAALWLWNGASWSAVGSLTGTIDALTLTPSNTVVIGGRNLVSGTTALGSVALWNGGYQGLGSGVNGTVTSLAVDATGNIHATGTFTSAGGTPAAGYARWTGVAWDVPTSPITPSVLANDGTGVLYGTNGLQVIRYSAGTWSSYATTGPGQTVLSLAADRVGDLVAGGGFSGGVAVFSASTTSGWMTLGTGTNTQVNVVAISGSTVVLGGPFSIAGGTPSGFLARASLLGGGVLGGGGGAVGTGISTGSGSGSGGTGASGGESITPESQPSTHCGLGGGAGLLLALGLVHLRRQRRRRAGG